MDVVVGLDGENEDSRVLPGSQGDCSRIPGLSLGKKVMYVVIRAC